MKLLLSIALITYVRVRNALTPLEVITTWLWKIKTHIYFHHSTTRYSNYRLKWQNDFFCFFSKMSVSESQIRFLAIGRHHFFRSFTFCEVLLRFDPKTTEASLLQCIHAAGLFWTREYHSGKWADRQVDGQAT